MRLRHLLLISTALMPLAALTAYAGPDGAQVVGGSATVSGAGSANVTINQFSDKAIINWRMFDIGVGERTTFVQPNSNSIALNRVTGGLGPTQILGSLNANGKVFVVNRDGIIFGPGAVITTAGFLATTSDIRNEDFMAGRFNFQIPGRPDASIVNMGTITATNGGFAALVAPGVRNSGTITASLGSIALGAGNLFTLDFYGDKLITLGIGDQIAGQVKDVATGQTLSALVKNEGTLRASGGRVELTAAAARHVVDSVINTSGIIEASSVGMRNGQIVLSAATADTKGNTPRQTVRVSGSLAANGFQKGTKGGKIVVTGENIELTGAAIDASGRAGGGTVMIGGDWGGGNPNRTGVNNQSAVLDGKAVPNATTVSVDATSTIDASAWDRGNGGKVVLWANDRLSFAGTIYALGGKEFGNGGFIETSGKNVADVSGTINAGRGGTWLLDPADITVNTGLAATIQSTLQGGTSVTQQTGTTPGGGNGDIIFDSGVRIVWNTPATLTLIAFRNITFNDGGLGSPNGNLVNTGAGNLVMRADSTGTGTGTLVMGPITNPTRINWGSSTGAITLYYNPTAFGTQDTFTSGGRIIVGPSSTLTQYMLVNSKTDLINIATNLAGTYALGKNIDASGAAMAPLGNISPTQFTGILDGYGGIGGAGNFRTISNMTIAPTSGTTNVGLFGVIGATGVVRNLIITNASITADPNTPPPGQFIGVVAGANAGTINNVLVTNSSVSNGTKQNGIIAGGLVGQNGIFGPGAAFGTITNSIFSGSVTVGNSSTGSQNNNAGGLVGSNPGTIANSFASATVTGGTNSFIGGFVGRNDPNATITGSGAAGNVNLSDSTGSGAGGFVGFNFGTISGINSATGNVTAGPSSNVNTAGNIGGFVGLNDAAGVISGAVAGGTVSGGGNSSVGGFAGFNNGTISGSAAAGNVTGGNNFTGGFVGGNMGDISSSTAIGAVSGGGFGTGGFAGFNGVNSQTGRIGTITGSAATGTVHSTATDNDGETGGFVGQNQGAAVISNSQAFGNVTANSGAGGFAGTNDGTISNSAAFGNVTIGSNGPAGGFVSGNEGHITGSTASGNVTGGDHVVVAGFAAGNFGEIANSSASGQVSATGPTSMVGGFAGLNDGLIKNSQSSGPVSGTSDSYLGGFVAINTSLIQDSSTSASASVTGSGANNFAGGFAGLNFGNIDPSTSAGNVSSGANSTVGVFVGANGALRFPDGTTRVGVVTGGSNGTGTATGGAGSTVGGQVGFNYPITGLPNLPTDPCGGGHGGFFCGGTLFNPNGSDQQDRRDTEVNIPQQSPLLNVMAAQTNDVFTEKKPDEVIKTSESTPGTAGGPAGQKGGQKGGGQNAGNAGRPPINVVPPVGLGPLPSGMPPINETRFASNEVVVQFGLTMTPLQVAALAEKNGLEIISQQTFSLLGRAVYRFRIIGGLSVRQAIAGVQFDPRISGQPSYDYMLDQGSGGPANQGDSAQYIVSKLGLVEAHGIATGKNVKVAVIDSEIDGQHPDLAGVIAGNFDALPSNDQTPHPHGTGMAGAIGSHQRLLGIAPGARILGVRAFGVSDTGAQGTSMNIVKGLEWAVAQGAQVINMSFAGPRDPLLEQAIKSLKDRGIILIAATGNAGAKSPPLFPGADPNVIGVSATDVDDKTYKNAVRGKQVAIAAPGVDILVPAPAGGYQLTTGTSVAAAHISGVVALLLERNPRLTPNDVRAILSATAKKLPQGRNEIGAGLVDPVQALSKAGPKQAEAR